MSSILFTCKPNIYLKYKMEAKFNFMNDLMNKNHQSFHDFKNIKWINPYEADISETKRDEFINNFSSAVKWSFKKTKPWINSVSKGCELCGQGEWSCLFITGQCNANCFYCPATQNNDDIPMAQQLLFENPNEYANFINYFNFKGLSFSGGEPFLVFDKVIEFLKTIRSKCSPDLYIWMYTNGILGSEDKFKILANLGLDEIRFDIGATNYKIDKIRMASGIIKNVTVEIPMDPVKVELLQDLIPQLEQAGVTNLNLHQMRLTNYNATKLSTKDYTYLHGEHPTVLESELGALQIIDFVAKNNYKIGVNYCAFQYKNRFQKAGYRTKVLHKLKNNDDISENGYLVKLYTSKQDSVSEKIDNGKPIIELLNSDFLSKISVSEFLQNYQHYEFVVVDFWGVILSDKLNNTQKTEIVSIDKQNYVLEQGRPIEPTLVRKNKLQNLSEILLGIQNPEIPEDDQMFQLWRFLKIESGFRSYF